MLTVAAEALDQRLTIADRRSDVTDSQSVVGWRLTKMHHIGLTVSDIERSVAFYCETLGMTLLGRRPHVDADYVGQQTGYPDVILNVASVQIAPGNPQTLELVQYMNHSRPPAALATNQAGTSHLCLVVDDLTACYEALKEREVEFRSAPVTITSGPNQGGLVVYFLDPDGYTLELFQPAAASIHETPQSGSAT